MWTLGVSRWTLVAVIVEATDQFLLIDAGISSGKGRHTRTLSERMRIGSKRVCLRAHRSLGVSTTRIYRRSDGFAVIKAHTGTAYWSPTLPLALIAFQQPLIRS